MAGTAISQLQQPDYAYLAQVKAQQDAQAAAEARAGTTAGTAAGNSTLAQWQVLHPGQQYGAQDAQDRALAFSRGDEAQRQQRTAWNQENQMGDLAINRAQMGLANMGRLMSGPAYGGSVGGGGFSGGSSGTSIPPVSSFPPVNYDSAAHAMPTLNAPDHSVADANTFARAKDQVGLTSRAALTGLAGAMAGRGTVGSGVEGRGQASAINAGQQQLGEVSRQTAITGADLAQKNAEANYQGEIAMRGQDINATTAANQAGLTARGQDISQRGQDISAGEFGQSQEQSAQEAAAQRALQQWMTMYNKSVY